MPLPKNFKPKFQADLVRLGGNTDGAYLIGTNSLSQSENLISYGIHDNWEFEKDFKNKSKNKHIKLKLYDDVLDFTFLIIKFLKQLIKLIFFQKNYFFQSVLNLFSYFSFCRKFYTKKKINKNDIVYIKDMSNVFFKIDIEGSEYELLDSLLLMQDNITGLAIEFHDLNKNLDKVKNFIEKFSLDLIHIHPNNWANIDENYVPEVLELSFEKNPKIISKNYTHPNQLDIKNCSFKKEITLKFED